MPLHNFIETPTCYERRHCHLCRDPLDGWFRIAMGNEYLTPPGWPECPFGVPWSTPELPPAVPSTLLNVIVENPDSEDAKAIEKRLYDRADLYRDICLNCPSNDFVAITEDGLQVECKVGYADCCNGKFKHGYVHLGVNTCNKEHWKKVALNKEPDATHRTEMARSGNPADSST